MIDALKQKSTIVRFGSKVRGDFDQFSDDDFLFVTDSIVGIDVRDVLNRYPSCAIYSWEKLSRMAKKKSLFIQHLKQESVVVSESDQGRFSEVLNSFTPKKDYSDEIGNSLSLLSQLSFLGDSGISRGWLLDVMLVLFRNILILKFATDSNYLFSYESLLNELVDTKIISTKECTILANLRRYKYYYRNGDYRNIPSCELIVDIFYLISSVIELNSKLTCCSDSELSDHLINSKRWLAIGNWYGCSRVGELYLLLKKVEFGHLDPTYEKLLLMLTRPQNYNLLCDSSIEELYKMLLGLD